MKATLAELLRPRHFLIFILLGLLVGCGPRLRILTEPPGSMVTIRDSSGRTIKNGSAPLESNVDFKNETRTYIIEVTPSEANTERYLVTTREVSSVVYNRLETVGDNKKQLRVKLDEKTYISLAYVEIVLDEKGRWRGVITKSRAYRDITETQGAVPSKIVDFGQNLGIEGLALSPDGNMIVYSVASYDRKLGNLEDSYGSAEDRLINIRGSSLQGVYASGGGIMQITNEDFRDMYPCFTPDGEYLLFASNRRRADSADILRISITRGGSGVANIYTDTRDAMALKPSQAINGTIAFSLFPQYAGANEGQIWTLGGESQFPTQIALGSFPQISPYGDRIAYIGADSNLWVVNVNGSNQIQLTFEANGIAKRFNESLSPAENIVVEYNKNQGVQTFFPYRYPSWSPDGDSILYTSMEGTDPTKRHNEDIWIMRYDGTEKRQLTTNGSADRYPLMSPDMKWIYFMSNRGGRWAIWRIQSPGVK